MQSIIELYNIYSNVEIAYICGCGNTLDKHKLIETNNQSLIICLNKSIEVLKKSTDILFVDRLFTLNLIKDKFKAKILMPLWSNFVFNLIDDKDLDIYYYSWGHYNERLLDVKYNYPLDLIQLYIAWGVSNSAINFCQRLKNIKKIILLGCNGTGSYYKNICKTNKRKELQHLETKKQQDIILKKIGINYEYW